MLLQAREFRWDLCVNCIVFVLTCFVICDVYVCVCVCVCECVCECLVFVMSGCVYVWVF